MGFGVLAAFLSGVLMVLCALLYIDKRELVEMLEEIQSNPSLPYIVVDRQKLAALIAKHKGKTNLTKKVRVCKK